MSMHIVHLETGRHLYGGARQVLMLLEGLSARGISVSLVCPSESAIATAADAGSTNVVTLPMRGDLDLAFARRFGGWLANARPDLVHVHSRRGGDLWGGLAARRANIPAVLSRRVDNPEVPLIGAMKYRLYDSVIAISAAIRQQLLIDGVRAARVRVVPSAVDESACRPSWSREQFLEAFGLGDDNLVVICVAQFIPRKGHADLLGAWPAVVAKNPQARLILFGHGPAEQAMRKRAADTGIAETVRFGGFREDLRQFMGRADVLVHPALKEGLGVCLLEAQAAGVPIVAAGAGGVPEAVSDGETGLLVPPGDCVALAGALIRMLGDQGMRSRMGAAGRDRIAQHFSPTTMVSGNLEVYEQVLGASVS